MNRILRAGAISLALLLPVGFANSTANGSEPSIQQRIAEIVDEFPTAVVDGNHIDFGDGNGVVLADAATYSADSCPSQRFCMWRYHNFGGDAWYRSSVGTHYPTGKFLSLWNNRSNASRLYNNDSTASFCYLPGASVISITLSYQTPEKFRLYSTTTC